MTDSVQYSYMYVSMQSSYGTVFKVLGFHPAGSWFVRWLVGSLVFYGTFSTNRQYHAIAQTFPFGRICFVVLVMRKGGERTWSGPWHLAFRLYIGSFPCAQLPAPVHTARLGCVFCVFSQGLCFVCSFVLFDMFVCLHSFMFAWAVQSSPLQFLALE